MVFRRFLAVFARPEHPLALFLDDLQWLDAATLDLLADLVTHPDVRHLILIGAYRDNEVSSSHPLMRTLEAIRKAGANVQEIVLAPFTRNDLSQLIADALHCKTERARPLAQLVHEKTRGNPFFAIHFVTTLAEEGLLMFNAGAAAWSWDLTRIRAKGYTDNVVDLLVGKLHRLPDTTQEATTDRAAVTVRLRQAGVTPAELPEAVLHYVLRTQDSVILDDAAAPNLFAADASLRQQHARSVLCLPLMTQTQLTGVLYLEHTLASHVCTPARLAVLRLLASQAAVALGNARLYGDLQEENRERQKAEDALRESEQRFRDYAEMASDWLWETGPDHHFTQVSEHLRNTTVGIDPASRIGVRRWDFATDVAEEPEKWRTRRSRRTSRFATSGTGPRAGTARCSI